MTDSTKQHRGLVVPGRLDRDTEHGKEIRFLTLRKLGLVHPGLTP
jgi:hypothetical protein